MVCIYRGSPFRVTAPRPCSPISCMGTIRACPRNGRSSLEPIRGSAPAVLEHPGAGPRRIPLASTDPTAPVVTVQCELGHCRQCGAGDGGGPARRDSLVQDRPGPGRWLRRCPGEPWDAVVEGCRGEVAALRGGGALTYPFHLSAITSLIPLVHIEQPEPAGAGPCTSASPKGPEVAPRRVLRSLADRAADGELRHGGRAAHITRYARMGGCAYRGGRRARAISSSATLPPTGPGQ